MNESEKDRYDDLIGLSEMMLDKAKDSVEEEGYGWAIEYVKAVLSVRPDMVVAQLTAFELAIGAQLKLEKAAKAKKSFFEPVLERVQQAFTLNYDFRSNIDLIPIFTDMHQQLNSIENQIRVEKIKITKSFSLNNAAERMDGFDIKALNERIFELCKKADNFGDIEQSSRDFYVDRSIAMIVRGAFNMPGRQGTRDKVGISTDKGS